MAKHEFGMMQDAPRQGVRYDAYEPQKYACISVDDEDIDPILAELETVNFCWHTRSVRGKGLAYCGITLIPPSSMDAMIRVVGENPNLALLKALLETARSRNKWVIHYGL